jgi:AcrR family transcriptional regulator
MQQRPSTGRIASRPLPRAERRQVILTGAARAFAASGFDATSMENIAEAAGVTKLIVYRHFDSKEELYRSILEEVSGRLGAEVSSARQRGQRRGVFGAAFLAVAREDPDAFELLWRHSSREPKFAEYAAGVRKAAVSFARSLLKSRVDQVLLDWAAPMIVAFLVEAVLNWLHHGDPGEDERFLVAVSRSLEGLILSWSVPA